MSKSKLDSHMLEDHEDEESVRLDLPAVAKDPERPIHPCIWRTMLLIGVLIYGSDTIFIHLCEVDGEIPFSSSSMVMVTEFMKLGVCIGMVTTNLRTNGFQIPSLRMALPFAVPAILYCINNNIAVHIQLEMDPASYQVLSNLKILSTAVLYRLIIKRPILPLQWVALGMLVASGVSNSYGGLHAETTTTSSTASQMHITMKGLMMMGVFCTISGLAGVYTEYILKRKYETSIYLQNGMLYTFGSLLNAVIWLTSTLNASEQLNLFRGYSVYTWLLVITQVANGLIMSAIMKHGNNITRLFIISSAMGVTTVLSMLLFGLQLNTFFYVSFALVLVALALYHSQ